MPDGLSDKQKHQQGDAEPKAESQGFNQDNALPCELRTPRRVRNEQIHAINSRDGRPFTLPQG